MGKVGQGMKPRGEAAKPQEKAIAEPVQAPTGEGQAESIIKPVLERLEVEQGGNTLEPETAAKPQEKAIAEPVQAPTGEGQAESIIKPVLERLEVEQGGNTLEPETAEKPQENEADCVAESKPEVSDLEKALQESTATILSATNAALQAQYDRAISERAARGIAPVQENPDALDPVAEWPQPNGDLKVVITIEEPYVNAVREWAEADGVTLEQWLSNLLYQTYATYGEPAKSR